MRGAPAAARKKKTPEIRRLQFSSPIGCVALPGLPPPEWLAQSKVGNAHSAMPVVYHVVHIMSIRQ
jgi:hypothetical protein